MVLDPRELSGKRLAYALRPFCHGRDAGATLHRMGARAAALAHRDAAERILDACVALVRGHTPGQETA